MHLKILYFRIILVQYNKWTRMKLNNFYNLFLIGITNNLENIITFEKKMPAETAHSKHHVCIAGSMDTKIVIGTHIQNLGLYLWSRVSNPGSTYRGQGGHHYAMEVIKFSSSHFHRMFDPIYNEMKKIRRTKLIGSWEFSSVRFPLHTISASLDYALFANMSHSLCKLLLCCG